MHVITRNMPEFHPKIQNPNLYILSFFLQFLYSFWNFLWLRKFKILGNQQTSYAVCYFEENCNILLQNHFKNDPYESELRNKSKLQFFFSKVLNFLRSFHRWKNENLQQRTNALSSRLFDGQLQFGVRKEPQNDTEIVKKIWQLFDKLVNF